MPDVSETSNDMDGRAGPRLTIRSDIINLIAGIAIIAAAVTFWVAAPGFDEQDATGVGPATFPKGIAALMGVCALVLIGQAIVRLIWFGHASVEVTTERPFPVLAGIILVAIYPALMATIGYYIATAVWMPVFLLVAGYRKPIGIALCTMSFLVFAKIVFDMILSVRLS
jgi:hypothetical protein